MTKRRGGGRGLHLEVLVTELHTRTTVQMDTTDHTMIAADVLLC